MSVSFDQVYCYPLRRRIIGLLRIASRMLSRDIEQSSSHIFSFLGALIGRRYEKRGSIPELDPQLPGVEPISNALYIATSSQVKDIST